MKLQEIIKSFPKEYDFEIEKKLINFIQSFEVSSLNDDLADILALSISGNYNKLAISILEKNYNGKKIELESMNKSLISQSMENYSLLHFAAQFGNKELLLYFLRNGVKISLDKDNFSPLHVLVFNKNLTKQDYLEVISEFKQVDSDVVNQRDAFFLTALHYAARQNNIPALEALIDSGASS